LADKDTAKAVLYVELSKPPMVPDLVKHVEERSPPSKIAALEGYKSIQAKLASSRNLEDLDNALYELSLLDLNNVIHFLPMEYARILNSLMEAYELELVYSKLASKILDEKPMHYVRLVDYDACTGVNRFSCVISNHLNKLGSMCTGIDEDCDRALGVAVLLDALLYMRYLDNLNALKLKEDIAMRELMINSIKYLKGAGSIYFESGLNKIHEALRDKKDLLETWCKATLALYEISKNALYYTNVLVDLITLYGIDRVLRYKLLRVIYSRWLKPW
jgi:hypothetical protein